MISFLGKDEIVKRLRRIDHEVSSSTGLYLDQWVLPIRSWWFGLQEAIELIEKGKSFRGRLSPRMLSPVRTAAILNLLHSSMSEDSKKLYRSRLLNDNNLNPVLFELQVASHLKLNGYSLEWLESVSSDNPHLPEFIANDGDHEIEFECKTQSNDAGRRVLRGKFYQLADLAIGVLRKQMKYGRVDITVPGRIPSSNDWRDLVVERLSVMSAQDISNEVLDDDTHIKLSLQPNTDIIVGIDSMLANENANKTPYSHLAIHTDDVGGGHGNPIIFRIESVSPDKFLQSTFDDLRDANQQFTGERTAIICCFVPDVSSFEGLGEKSALRNMTSKFFNEHARDCICKVIYSSNSVRNSEGNVISSFSPALSFEGNTYNNDHGDCPRIIDVL